MTDNYQIDKNSKLFQKFLNLKNKNNESTIEKQPNQNSTKTLKADVKVNMQKSYESYKQHEEILPQKRPQLHVTISDIEQAAQVSFHQEDNIYQTRKGTNEKQSIPKYQENLSVQLNSSTQKLREEKTVTNELQNQSKAYESFKPERTRDRRTRDFSDRNRATNENKMQRSFRMNDVPPPIHKPNATEITLKNNETRKQKQNLMSLNEDEEPMIKEENTFTLGSREGEYKKKYDKVYQKYEQLKQTIQKQRKQKQQQLNDKEAQLQLIRQKYFQVRSNEDTLTNELKRIKQRLQSENMVRTKYQQQVKELTFKIQELQDMLDGKQANLKKKLDETSHWKGQNQQFRAQVKLLNGQIEKLEDRCQFLQSQNKMLKKDLQNKQLLIQQLRKNISNIIQENNIAKDEIYKLTIKAYHFQQENQVLKGDLMRRDREQPHQMSVIQQNYMRNIQSLSPKRRERPEKIDRVIIRQERAERQTGQGNNRRRQFARQRANTSKPQRMQRPTQREEIKREIPERRPQQNQRKTQPMGSKQREIVLRVQELQAELQKRKDQKAMNGKLRRQKIEMERQLEQLIGKLNG